MIRSDAVPFVLLPSDPRRSSSRLLTTSAVSSCVAGNVASCSAFATVDTGGGDSDLVGLAEAGWGRFDVSGLPVVPSSASGGNGAAVSLGGVVVVDVGSSCVSPPVLMTTPGVAERSAVSVVLESSVGPMSPGFAVPSAAPGLAGAGSVPEALLGGSRLGGATGLVGHARPLLHPVMMAAPRPKATAKPPTRPAYASCRHARRESA